MDIWVIHGAKEAEEVNEPDCEKCWTRPRKVWVYEEVGEGKVKLIMVCEECAIESTKCEECQKNIGDINLPLDQRQERLMFIQKNGKITRICQECKSKRNEDKPTDLPPPLQPPSQPNQPSNQPVQSNLRVQLQQKIKENEQGTKPPELKILGELEKQLNDNNLSQQQFDEIQKKFDKVKQKIQQEKGPNSSIKPKGTKYWPLIMGGGAMVLVAIITLIARKRKKKINDKNFI